MTEEVYREFEKYYEANKQAEMDRARKVWSLEIARGLISRNLSVEDIAEVTKLDRDEVLSLQKEIGLA